MSTGHRPPIRYGGIDVFLLLTAVLVALKVFNLVEWSWWWVLSPLWLGAIFCIVSIALGLFFVQDYSDHGDGP